MSRIDTRFVLDGDKAALEAIRNIGRAVKSGDIVTRAGRSIERSALKTLVVLTPRQRRRREPPTSRRGGRPLYKDWKAITVASVKGALYQSVIANEAAKTPEGDIILRSLESGARPHDIDPVKGDFMQWISSGQRTRFLGRGTLQNGNIVDRVKSSPLSIRPGQFVRWGGTAKTGVQHPGVRKPFGMVTRTAALMDPVAAKVGVIVMDSIGLAWGGEGNVRLLGFGS